MNPEKLWISSTVPRFGDTDELLRDFAEKNGISGKDFLHMRLLMEETIGMTAQLAEPFDGEIRIEKTPSGYDIILEAAVHHPGTEAGTPSASPEGFMSRIAGMLNCSYVFENAGEMPENLAGLLPDYMSYGIRDPKDAPAWAGKWSLAAYRYNLRKQRETHPENGIALDELEKSIVAQLSDDVTIGIHGTRIRMVISGSLTSLA